MFSRILIPLDGSQLSERALPHAVQMARIFNAQLVLLQVLEASQDSGLIDPLSWQIKKSEADLYLRETAAKLAEQGLNVDYQTLEGRSPEAIIHFAQNNAIDLVVLSSHGRSGLSRWDISSVVAKVLEKIYLPLLLVRAYQPSPEGSEAVVYKKLLLPVDYSKRSECALQVSLTIADATQGEVILAHILRRPEVPQGLPETAELTRRADDFLALARTASEAYMEELRSRIPGLCSTHVVESHSITRELHELADQEGVDLVVICAHGHGGPSDWPYGTVARHYIEHGSHSVLVMQDIPPTLAKPTLVERAVKQQGGR